jgi:tetratricopeptide (TPR) repeat protein
LGIELAAAWVRTLPMSEIAAEIAHDLNFLSSSTRDIPERHRSLRVVFDHSWSLLLPIEQRALRQLSAFRGGFTREAAQEVAETLLPILNSLLDKSLLRRSELARYDFLELVRIYAAAHLADKPEEETSVRERHSRFYLSLICDAGSDLHNGRQTEALDWISSELANIRSAWAWAIEHNQIGLLSEAAQSMWYFYELRNYYREGEAVFGYAAEVVRRSLEGLQTELPEADREKNTCALGQFLMFQAYFVMRLGKLEEAKTICEASIFSLRLVHDCEALAHALTYYAVLNWTIGNLNLAWTLLQESLPLSREYGSPWQFSLFTGIMGNVAYERGDYEHSYRLLSEAFESSKIIGDPRLTGFIAAYLGRTALKVNRTSEIEWILWDAAQLTQESGDRFGYGLILEQLALAAQAKRDFTVAQQLFEASVNIFHEIGDVWYLSRALTSFGDFRRSLGDLTQATEYFKQAIKLSLDVRAFLIALNAFVGLAGVYAQEGKAESALEVAVLVLAHPASPQNARSCAKLIQRDMKSRLTPDEIKAIQQRAYSGTLEEYTRVHL